MKDMRRRLSSLASGTKEEARECLKLHFQFRAGKRRPENETRSKETTVFESEKKAKKGAGLVDKKLKKKRKMIVTILRNNNFTRRD